MTDQKVIVKWKYRECHPQKRNHTIDDYIRYVEKQVEERRNETGDHLQDNNQTIGNSKHDCERILEISDKNWQQGEYLSYIDERKGSSSCFSSENVDVDSLKEQLSHLDGCVWIPIVSTKEKDARVFGLDTEAQWIAKGRELAEEYRKSLGIEKDNYRWIAAFHTKPEGKQNKEADAGMMPHLHYMIWEDKPTRSIYTLKARELDNIRQKTFNVLAREYMTTFYEERNRMREELTKTTIKSMPEEMGDVLQLIHDIQNLTKGNGKLNVSEFEKRLNVCVSILDKIEAQKEPKFTKTEEYYINRLELNTIADVKRNISNYKHINDKLEEITTKLMLRPDTSKLLSEWFDTSMKMRLGVGVDLAEKQTYADLDQMRRNIKNAILKEAKNNYTGNTQISNELKGVLLDRLNRGSLRTISDIDSYKNAATTIASLCKSVGMSETEAFKEQYDLLNRSNKTEYEKVLTEIIEEVYLSEQYGFKVTNKDFYDALKLIGIPKELLGVKIYDQDMNPDRLAVSVIAAPIIDTTIQTSTILDSNVMGKTLVDSYILGKNVLTATLKDISSINETLDYEGIYTSLLEAFTNYNQESVDIERDEIELQRKL